MQGQLFDKKEKTLKKKMTSTTTQCEHNRHSGEGGANLIFGCHNISLQF